MSSGICILNKNGVAMAADSAGTLSGHAAIYNSVNKLFSISKVLPVGVIIYQNIDYMGIPMEILIKEYKEKEGSKKLDSLNEYLNDFCNYVSQNRELFRLKQNEKLYVFERISSYIKEIHEIINDIKQQTIDKKINTDQLSIFALAISSFMTKINNSSHISNYWDTISYIASSYANMIEHNISQNFNYLSSNLKAEAQRAIIFAFGSTAFVSDYTGFVIAGYGDKDLYPRAIHVQLIGLANSRVLYREIERIEISDNNNATIIPLAQIDIIQSIIKGINPYVLESFINSLSDNAKDSQQQKRLKTKLLLNIEKISRDCITQPLLNTLATLPKEEMIRLAEALINITSVQRAVVADNKNATVGGPTDVAILSRGDGFIWIKRKHYFDKDYNLQYLYNHYGSVSI